MLESLLNKVAALQPETLLKKTLQHRFFPVNFAKFSRTLSLHDCLIFHYFKRDLTLHISFHRIPHFCHASSKRMRMKINKLKVWKKVEKFVGQRYFSRSQDKFYVIYNFYNLKHLQKHLPGGVLSKSCY